MVEAFRKACTPNELGEMTEQLKLMFYDAATVTDKDGNTIRLEVDPKTRVQIWKEFAAYGMGEPVKRTEEGTIGELTEYLERLMGANGEDMGDTEADSRNIRASWIRPRTSD